jgi:hypothetical protein
VTEWQTGNPFTPVTSGLPARTGIGYLRPDQNGSIKTTGKVTQWFANTVYCDPTFGADCSNVQFLTPKELVGGNPVYHFGDVHGNSVYGPGFTDTDFSIRKTTKITERISHEFRFEAFDVFNHPNFGQPGRIVGLSSFGKVLSTRFQPGDSGSSRQLQFAMKLIF